jgi:hypothetical protein
MKKIKTTSRKVEVVVDITCDCCGKSCKKFISNDGVFNFEYMTLKAKWGYGSKHDLEAWEAQVCEGCVDKKFKGIKFKKEEYDWINGETTSEAQERASRAGFNIEFRRKHGLKSKKKNS